MKNLKFVKAFLLFILVYTISAMPAIAATGYGTSSIVLSKSTINLTQGGSTSVNYTVNLASGSTWGTNLNVANSAQLLPNGISVKLSNSYGDPPYSGILTVYANSTSKKGLYNIVLSATGDDPSTNNTILQVYVNTRIYTVTAKTAQPNATTSILYGTSPAYQSFSANALFLAIGIAIILIVMTMAIIKKREPASRLIILGVAIIFVGILVWLYGDYSGGNFTYIWSGVILILIGIFVWLAGDHKGRLI